MLSKIKVAVVSVVLVALAFGGFSVALAASSAPNSSTPAAVTPPASGTAPATAAATGANWAMGVISALGPDNFTTTGPLGGTHVVYVNAQTVYYNRDAQASNFAGLQVGDRVLAAATKDADGKATAKLVVDLGARTSYKGAGVASAVNSSEQSFTFVNGRGRVWDFYVDANTKITDKKGDAKTFADIQPGTRLAVQAEKRADGKWWAVNIKIGKTVPPVAGTQS
jgi:hypothetical protein